jgi:hypothetical protein
MPEPHLRASDSDRSAVATALGEHMAAGRLTLAEYEERLAQVYETKTLGGLAALTADLPPTAASRASAPTPTFARSPQPARGYACAGGRGSYGRSAWGSWRSTALIVLSIWLVTSLAAHQLFFFWPLWVIGPWGAVLLAHTLRGNGRDGRGEGRLNA